MRIRKRNRTYSRAAITTINIKPKESVVCKQIVIRVKQMKAWGLLSHVKAFIHIPNENITSPAYRIHLKAMGLMPGISDYMVLYDRGVAFLEIKRDAKCKLSQHQEIFFELLKSLNIPCLCTHDIDTVITFLENLKNSC